MKLKIFLVITLLSSGMISFISYSNDPKQNDNEQEAVNFPNVVGLFNNIEIGEEDSDDEYDHQTPRDQFIELKNLYYSSEDDLDTKLGLYKRISEFLQNLSQIENMSLYSEVQNWLRQEAKFLHEPNQNFDELPPAVQGR